MKALPFVYFTVSKSLSRHFFFTFGSGVFILEKILLIFEQGPRNATLMPNNMSVCPKGNFLYSKYKGIFFSLDIRLLRLDVWRWFKFCVCDVRYVTFFLLQFEKLCIQKTVHFSSCIVKFS